VRCEEIAALRDDDPRRPPTKENILRAFTWLTEGVRPGDALYLHYSGHGGQTRDISGDEADGRDETLLPVDYRKAGCIKDDSLRELLVSSLPHGVSLLCLMDCCHSGTGMDLPFAMKLSNDGSISFTRKKGQIAGPSQADVLAISGCMDSQTSADTYAGSCFTGAMTKALSQVITHEPQASFHRILQQMRNSLKEGGYSQVPQMSSEHMLKVDEAFVASFRRAGGTKLQ